MHFAGGLSRPRGGSHGKRPRARHRASERLAWILLQARWEADRRTGQPEKPRWADTHGMAGQASDHRPTIQWARPTTTVTTGRPPPIFFDPFLGGPMASGVMNRQLL